MAKIRSLKSEINYLTYEVISDCNTFMLYRPEKKEEAVKLIEEVVEYRNEIIRKINSTSDYSHAFFREITSDFIGKIDMMFEKLRSLINS